MKNTNLDTIFNIDDSDVTAIEKTVEISDVDNSTTIDIKKDVEKDYKYSRSNIYSIIEKGQDAINGALELARETESPRAYEVTGQLIKNVADATEKLLDLQKKLKDIEEVKEIKGPSTVNNSLFIGSTAELTKFIKSQKTSLDDK
ncbi:MAG: terminase small subunit [Candidatus Nanopelagicaceae bacterium]